MCNCGKKRNQIALQPERPENREMSNGEGHYINFEYTGNTALSITGNYTKAYYRFHRTGDIQPVDDRDARGMAGIPVLKLVG